MNSVEGHLDAPDHLLFACMIIAAEVINNIYTVNGERMDAIENRQRSTLKGDRERGEEQRRESKDYRTLEKKAILEEVKVAGILLASTPVASNDLTSVSNLVRAGPTTFICLEGIFINPNQILSYKNVEMS